MSTYTIPYVVQQTPRGERTLDLYSRLLSERIIYLGTELDDGVANAVIAQLLHLASENPEPPISLYINSPGGSITAMLAVYDAMQFVSPRSRRPASARRRGRRPCCWPAARPAPRDPPTGGSYSTSPPPRAAARSPT